MKRDSLGDRMKAHEACSRYTLPRRMPVIIRVDGKAFHTLTRGCMRPFDAVLAASMDAAAAALCKEAQGAVFGYTQSDEISILLHNYKRHESEAWFDNNLQKIVSVSAAIATEAFNAGWLAGGAKFDARAFVLPEAEVSNYFLWRQQDAIRNSIQMAARARFSHKQCDNKHTKELVAMLAEAGIRWEDYAPGFRYGRAVSRVLVEHAGPDGEKAIRAGWQTAPAHDFKLNPSIVDGLLAVEPEAA